jgi:ankyrin repeat protein
MLINSYRFLWAHLQLNEIFLRNTVSDIRLVLASMPVDLNATYKRIGQQIDERHRKYVKRTILWLAASLEPMSRENLSETLMVNQETFNINPEDRLLDSNLILEMCRSLVSMQDDGSVSLIHLSLKQFLISGDAGDFGIIGTKEMHLVAARACFAYLTSGRHNPHCWVGSCGLGHYKRYRQAEQELAFLDYCCRHAFGHLKQDPGVESEFIDLLPQIFQSPESRQHFNESFRFWEKHSKDLPRYSSFQSNSKFSVRFGLLTDSGSYGRLDLCWNSSLISRLVVAQTKLLVEDSIKRSLEFTEPDEQGWSAICFSAALGDCATLESMIAKLLESGQSISRPLGSALIAALGCGEKSSVSLLLDTIQAKINTFDSPGLFLLQGILTILACMAGDHQLIQQLLASPLDHNGSPCLADREELQIALVAAALEGHKQCVVEVLRVGVKPRDSIYPVRYQALWHAERDNFFLVANALWIGRDIQPSKAPEDSNSDSELKAGILASAKSAISAAVKTGNRVILEILYVHYPNKFELVPDWGQNKSYSYLEPESDRFETTEPILTRLLETCPKIDGHNAKLDQVIFWCAAKKERFEILKNALAIGADANTTDAGGNHTPLIIATENDDTASMELLLRHGADIDRKTYRWPSGAIGAAIYLGNISAFRLLLSHTVDANLGGPQGIRKWNTLLIEACSRYRYTNFSTPKKELEGDPTLSMVEGLLKTGSDPNFLAEEGDYGTALIAACAMGHIEVINKLLHHRSDPNLKAKCGMYGTALAAAAKLGNVNAAKTLLNNGADPNQNFLPPVLPSKTLGRYNEKSQYESAFIAAAEIGDQHVLELLENHNSAFGLKINEVIPLNKYGTPLIAAVYSGNLAAIDFLLKHGADPNLEVHPNSASFCTASIAAFKTSRNLEIPNLFLKYITPVLISKHAAYWVTVLVANITEDRTFLAKLMLDMGVPLNQRIDMEDTEFREYGLPIIAAIKQGNFAFVKELVVRGANIHFKDVGEYGDCLTAAVASGNLQIVNYILQGGANPNSMSFHRKYWSPFIAAASLGYLEILQVLIEHGGNPDVFYTAQNTPLREFEIKSKEMPLFDALRIIRLWNNTQVTSYDSKPARETENSSFGFVWGHPLIAAIVCGHEDIVDHLIKAGVSVNLTTDAGEFRTPLIAAFRSEHFERANLGIARTLLLEGADPNVMVPHNKYGSAIIAAATTDNYEGIDLLQEREVIFDPRSSVRDCSYGSVLIAASHKTRSDYADSEMDVAFIKRLVEDGCSPKEVVKGSLFGSAVIAAASELHLDFIHEFLKHGVDLNQQTNEGIYGYPLMAALARESLIHAKFKYNFREEEAKFKFVRALLKLGAKPNVVFNNRTPLIIAMEKVRTFDEEIVQDLLSHGAEINKVVPRYLQGSSEDGRKPPEETYSALTAAAEQDKHDIVKILLERGGDPKLLPAGYCIREETA